jgi:hypothetical protein
VALALTRDNMHLGGNHALRVVDHARVVEASVGVELGD